MWGSVVQVELIGVAVAHDVLVGTTVGIGSTTVFQ